MSRILVTGSRDWLDIHAVERALLEYHPVDSQGFDLPDKPTLVHGDCPRGADRMAKIAAKFLGWKLEPHPANWETLGKRAGFVRNAEMVELGADVCLAFIRNGSKGATHTAELAEKAGIPVRRFLA
jgi:hypothetical protein